MDVGTKVELGNCENCGAAVRENTFFCYNCGHKLADISRDGTISINEDEARTALSEITERIEGEKSAARGLEIAAKERKRSRATKLKRTEVVWSPGGGPSNVMMLLVSSLIATMVFAVIFVMVLWK